jgi:hypothetical protein
MISAKSIKIRTHMTIIGFTHLIVMWLVSSFRKEDSDLKYLIFLS